MLRQFSMLLAFSALASNAYATVANNNADNLVDNGSFSDLVANATDPTDWTTPANGFINTADILDENNNFGFNFRRFAAAPVGQEDTWSPDASDDGGTWLGIARSPGTHFETVTQTVGGFMVGQTYSVSWEEANFGYIQEDPVRVNDPITSYLNDNRVRLDLSATGLFHEVSFAGSLLSIGQEWQDRSFEFTASATEYDLSLSLNENERSYLSFDGLQITAIASVPEPSTWALLLLGGLIIVGAQGKQDA